MELKDKIKNVLEEYGCLHKNGKLWDEIIQQQRNEELIDALFNLHIVSRQFKDKEAKTFIEWYLSEGYIPTERTGVYKNGCNIVLGEDLYLKYTEAIKVKP